MADSEEFKAVAEKVRKLTKAPTNAEYAEMYSLYKQATAGDCTLLSPVLTDPLGKEKFEAWKSRKGLTKAEAAALYIEKGTQAAEKYGTSA